jgi:hypothetical protein
MFVTNKIFLFVSVFVLQIRKNFLIPFYYYYYKIYITFSYKQRKKDGLEKKERG